MNGFGYKQTMTPFLGITSRNERSTHYRQQMGDPGLHAARLCNLGQGQGPKYRAPEYLSLYAKQGNWILGPHFDSHFLVLLAKKTGHKTL